MSNWTFFPIAITFLGFALTLLVTSKPKLQKLVSIGIASCYLSFGLYLLSQGSNILPMSLQVADWRAPFGITLRIDYLSAILLTVTGIVYLCVTVYSNLGDNAESSALYFPLIHIIIAGISGAFSTQDLFNLYVWFEVILLSSFVALGMVQNKSRLSGAFKYIVLNILSSMIFLLAAGLIYNVTHTLNFELLSSHLEQLQASHPSYVLALNITIFIAFAIKAGLFPFFFWLPASYHHISPAISGLFAGLLTKVGLYAMFRVNFMVFPADTYIETIAMALSSLSILIGVAGAIVQTNIRRILSFHIISQVGYIGLAGSFLLSENPVIRSLGFSAALFYMVHHIIVKANLFLVSGLLASYAGSERLAKLGGIMPVKPLLAFLFAVPALSLAGIPPMSGFWAKFTVFKTTLTGDYFLLTFVMVVGGFFTVYSMTKIWLAAFWGKPPEPSPQGVVRVSAIVGCSLLSLSTLVISLHPDLLYGHVQEAVNHLMSGVANGKGF
ncbi:MAG: Na+/H+ antiporter subunit D [Pseudobacteriovorax sp.]|nr:Na+/H+ antiporter subunit D [Pseudobacteriovorax sp.]